MMLGLVSDLISQGSIKAGKILVLSKSIAVNLKKPAL
jgi:hypothetical protein